MNLQPEHYELLVVSRAAPVEVFGAQPALVEVFDWWEPQLKQLTLHAGAAWGREQRRELQFLALDRRLPGTVAVLEWWDPRAQRLTLRPMSAQRATGEEERARPNPSPDPSPSPNPSPLPLPLPLPLPRPLP